MLDCFENEQVHHDQLRSQGADVKIKKRLHLVERWSRSRRTKAQGSGRLNFQYCRCGSRCLHRSMHAALFLLFVLAVRSSGADEFAEDREAFEISGERSLSVANATSTSSSKTGPIAAYLFLSFLHLCLSPAPLTLSLLLLPAPCPALLDFCISVILRIMCSSYLQQKEYKLLF